MALPLAPTTNFFAPSTTATATGDPTNERANVLAFYYFMGSVALRMVALVALAVSF
jgi:hypothetical protein